MIRSAVKVLPVALSVSLVASCFLPCYTLAYADQPTYGGANYEQLRENQPERSGDGQVDQGADFQGLLRREAPEEASSGSELLSLAGAGRVRSSADVLVEASYSLADSLIRLASARAYAVELQGVEDVSQEEQEEVAGSSGGFEFAPGGGESNADAADGGAAAEGHGADDGAAAGAGEATPEVDENGQIGLLTGSISASLLSARSGGSFSNVTGSGGGFSSSRYIPSRSIFEANKYWIGGSATNTAGVVDTYVSWFSGDGQNKRLNALIGVSGGLFQLVSDVNSWLHAIHAVSVDTKNYSVAYLPFIEDVYQLQQSQWGYNYGGTAIIQKSSPAWYLQLAANRLNYNGSLTGGDPDDYSAARLLARIHNSQYGSITYSETGNTGMRSTIGVLGYVANLLYQNNLYNESATTRLHYVGGLVGEVGSGDYSAARLLARIHNGLYGSITYSETGNTGVRSAISVLGYIANLVYQGDQYLSSAATRLHYIGPLSGVDGEGDYSVARLLARIHNYNHSIYSLLQSLVDSSGSSVDLSQTNRLLGRLTADVADIRDKFVLEDTLSDLLELLVGDLQVPQTQAAISRIQDVMATRFPFCIPSVVNVVLFGSLLADPAPPVWTFDVGGSPLVVDFADYGAFAEVSSWTVRLLFTAALLLNTRRFVYGVGGGD